MILPVVRPADSTIGCATSQCSDLGLSYDLYEGLTEREELIAQMVARGNADWEIARDLCSDDLVAIRNEIHAVMNQLNVESELELSRVMSRVNL